MRHIMYIEIYHEPEYQIMNDFNPTNRIFLNIQMIYLSHICAEIALPNAGN